MNELKSAELHTFKWLQMEGQDRWKKVSISLVGESSQATMGRSSCFYPSHETQADADSRVDELKLERTSHTWSPP